MTLHQRVLEIASFQGKFDAASAPETVNDMDHRLNVITDAIQFLRNRNARSTALVKEHAVLLDLWTYVALEIENSRTGDVFDEFPKTDPLTLLTAAKNYGLMPAAKADSLTAAFMKKVKKAVGHDLTPQQVAALHGLFRNYNPLGNTGPEGGRPMAPLPPEA